MQKPYDIIVFGATGFTGNLVAQYLAGLPEGEDDHRPQDLRVKHAELLSRRPITPSAEEIAVNPRSRSAKLRGLRKR